MKKVVSLFRVLEVVAVISMVVFALYVCYGLWLYFAGNGHQ